MPPKKPNRTGPVALRTAAASVAVSDSDVKFAAKADVTSVSKSSSTSSIPSPIVPSTQTGSPVYKQALFNSAIPPSVPQQSNQPVNNTIPPPLPRQSNQPGQTRESVSFLSSLGAVTANLNRFGAIETPHRDGTGAAQTLDGRQKTPQTPPTPALPASPALSQVQTLRTPPTPALPVTSPGSETSGSPGPLPPAYQHPEGKSIYTWSEADVVQWAKSLSIASRVVHLFDGSGFDGDMLANATENELRLDLCVERSSDRRKILREVAAMVALGT
eukprot:CAMPEP_0175131944 /NCGR_PEP_ID=MMETSP0087-20121206/6814_1 /TAXON_ID=136419 /ORGANISM="Unknown Unknown, Strain D1" /LENGTH=272 /DNA_ID=CAMNT_0016414271 /DNA_START=615 /DNA_END=1433 /DNA_ORIENTATION=-